MIKREHAVEFITIEQREKLIDKLHEWLCEFGYGDSPDDALYMAEGGADRFLMYCGKSCPGELVPGRFLNKSSFFCK